VTYVPQLVCGDSELGVLEVVVHAVAGLGRQPRPVVPDRRADGGAYPGEHLPLPLFVDVETRSQEEAHRGEQHEAHRDGEPDAPPDVVLEVDDGRDGDGEGHADRRVVGVEVGLQDHGPLLLGVPRELVRAERHGARPDAAGAQRQERETGEQPREVPRPRRRALLAVVARGRTRSGDRGAQPQEDHPL
jgi:hypothetical protein